MWQDGKFVLLVGIGTVLGIWGYRWLMVNHHPAAKAVTHTTTTKTPAPKKATGTPNAVLG